ncbi:MAG: ATP-binding cassette domain-containing protein [Calditrichia bacterium]
MALVGATGSGKVYYYQTVSWLMRSIRAGVYRRASGGILLAAISASANQVCAAIAVPFSTTVKRNIAYADPLAPKAKIWASAQLAKADQLESVLPDGYETMVSEKGVTLSGGQKQRVALAQTLLTEPDILVLDDVTSQWIPKRSKQFSEALQKEQMRKTTIIISHRVTTIQQADRVLVIHQGRIVQEENRMNWPNIQGIFAISISSKMRSKRKFSKTLRCYPIEPKRQKINRAFPVCKCRKCSKISI